VQRRLKRNKLEIFHDILIEIQNESTLGKIRPTRIQQKCNMSYDKFVNNIQELEKRQLITSNCERCSDFTPLCITEIGRQYLEDYEKINNFLEKMKLDYFDEGDHLDEI